MTASVVLVLSFWKYWGQGNPALPGEEQTPQVTEALPEPTKEVPEALPEPTKEVMAALPEPTKEVQAEVQPQEQELPSEEAEQVSQPAPETAGEKPSEVFLGLGLAKPAISMQESFGLRQNAVAAWEIAENPEPQDVMLNPLPDIERELPVKAALVTDAATGKILYGYHAYGQITPASVTKLMTMLLALERGKLDDVLVVTDTALAVGHWDAVMCGFRRGDQVTLYDVLHGMMISSGNDAAAIVAEYISGSVEEFVTLMNERAAELGAHCTNFANPHGLPNDEHLTSAYDISLVMQELSKHEEFFEIASKKSYKAYFKNAKGADVSLTFKTTNQYMSGKYKIADGIELLAGKTGTTTKAGKCLTLFVRARDGKLYLAELFGAGTLDDLYFFMNQLLEIINSVAG